MLHFNQFFQSHMLLPQNVTVPIWGKAEAGKRVVVECGGEKAEALSNANGEFRVWLPPLKAGGPLTLRAWLPECDEQVLLEDILVGELWLASGQSNMSMSLKTCAEYGEEAIASANHPTIRLFTVERRAVLTPESDVSGTWQVCSPETVALFSAVGYAFAKRLACGLSVPVGVVSSAWGGSFLEAWISQQGLARLPHFRQWEDAYRQEVHQPDWWERYRNDLNEEGLISILPVDQGNRGWEEGWAASDFDDSEWEQMLIPGKWQTRGHENSGVFWFRLQVDLPEEWQGKRLMLHLGAIDKTDITYANGEEVGRMGEGLDSGVWEKYREYGIPESLSQGERLSLAVRVVSFRGEGGLAGPAEEMRIYPEGHPELKISLGGEWRCCREQDYGVITETALMGHGNHNSPHILFDNMIRPMMPMPFRGVLWYQGESNARRAEEYEVLLRGLIEDWRWQFAQPELGFYVVQLPEFNAAMAYEDGSTWAVMREAQRAVSDLEGVGLAVTLGLGDALDIHPKNKGPVGERLARAALVGTYGQDLLPGGPMIASCERSGHKVLCRFDHTGDGLRCEGVSSPDGFTLAGKDGVFLPAEARIISENQVEVSAAQVAEPCQVRYAWADNPLVHLLCNSEHLPASPFGCKF
ncbi:sialate O-acetylesterase [Kiritimatiellota bacterium B12222]|nr:sialate O-acetylesterase [Kiritimatiellota bacterium B12222]